MPYKSDAQRKFMHAKHPDIAKRWDKEYPDQKDLPEHVKKSSVEQRLILHSAIKLASQVKQGGVMDLIERLGAKVGPMVGEHVMSPVAKGVESVAGGSLGSFGAGLAKKVAPYTQKATSYLNNAGNMPNKVMSEAGDLLDTTHAVDMSHMGHMGPATMPTAASPNAARNIGLATVGGVGGLGAMGMLGHANRDKEASIGTPYTDGVLSWCLKNKLNSEQVLDLLEKGAEQTGKAGQECKAFLDRLLSE